MHAEQIEYRYVRVRELRRHGTKYRPGSTVCIERNASRRGSGRRLRRKTGTAVSWPRRGRRGLRLHRGALSHGGSRSYGGRAFAASLKLDLLPSPGFETPAQAVGKYSSEVERRPKNSQKEGPLTDYG